MPTTAACEIMCLRSLGFDFFPRTPLPPFLPEIAHVQAGRLATRCLVDVRLQRSVRVLFYSQRMDCATVHEDQLFFLQVQGVVRDMLMCLIFVNNPGQKPLELLVSRIRAALV